MRTVILIVGGLLVAALLVFDASLLPRSGTGEDVDYVVLGVGKATSPVLCLCKLITADLGLMLTSVLDSITCSSG